MKTTQQTQQRKLPKSRRGNINTYQSNKLKFLLPLTAIAIILLDQLTKNLALKSTFQKNFGIAFGLLAFPELKPFLIIIYITFIIFIIILFRTKYSKAPLVKTALTLIIAGTFSNLLDRILHGFVIDFIKIASFPSFNIADISNTLGAALLIIWLIKNRTQKQL